MNGERGFSYSGFLGATIVLIVVAMLGYKFIVPYTEYRTIVNDMKEVVNNPDLADASGPEIRNAFAKKALIDDIQSVSAEDLEIKKDPLSLHVKYEKKVPVFDGIGFYLDFDAEAVKGGH